MLGNVAEVPHDVSKLENDAVPAVFPKPPSMCRNRFDTYSGASIATRFRGFYKARSFIIRENVLLSLHASVKTLRTGKNQLIWLIWFVDRNG